MAASGKERICAAMLRLMSQHELKDIKVKDVIAEADVNRSTFYYHFGQPMDVVEYLMGEITDHIYGLYMEMKQSLPVGEKREIEVLRETERKVYSYIQENRNVYGFFLNSEFENVFIDRLIDTLKRAYMQFQFCFQAKDGGEAFLLPKLEFDFFCELEAYKNVCAYNYWVNSGADGSAEEFQKMIQHVNRLQVVCLESSKTFFEKKWIPVKSYKSGI